MADIVEELKQKKKKIEQLQRDKANQEGQQQQLLERLKHEFDVDSVEKAEEKLEVLGKELIKNEKFLEELDAEMGKIIHNALPGNSS